MLERQYSNSSASENGSFIDLEGFRPIALYDNRVDVIDDSLTLSRSAGAQQLPQFSTLSSRDLDEIDRSCLAPQELQQAKEPRGQAYEVQQQHPPPPQPRNRGYAAGDELFNYRALGSLRSGLAPIALFSRWHAGLAVTAFASGATLAFAHAAYNPLLFDVLNDRFDGRYDATTMLIDWPGISSVLLGLFSDCVPIQGTRRKAYIALGWILSAVFYAAGCAVYLRQIHGVEQPDSSAGSFIEAFGVIGSFGLQLSWVAALALIVGFGQRENLRERGGLAMLVLVIWQTGMLIAHVAVVELQSILTLPSAGAALATTSMIALPCVCWFLHDDDERESAESMAATTKLVGVVPALRTGVVQLWEICQEKVTYRVLFFFLVYGALLTACDPDVDKALAGWSGFTSSEDNFGDFDLRLLVVKSGVALAALLHAKWRLLSSAWRPLALTGCVIVFVGTLVRAIVTATDTVRAKWLFSLLTGAIAWPETWILFLKVLAITEVAHVGCEGVTMGLVLSFQGLGTATSRALSSWVSSAANIKVAVTLFADDSQDMRTRAMSVAAAYAAVNLLAAVSVPWLPCTKLEAQQLRAFGGYSRRGSIFTVLLFAGLLVVVIISNMDIV